MNISFGPILSPEAQRDTAESFLHILSKDTNQFTFQTFTDCPEIREQYRSSGMRDPLARVLHGSLDQHWDTLVLLSDSGAGIFVVINETDLNGRATANVKRVRAYFVDLDGAPISNLARLGLFPLIVTQTSQNRYHAYWIIEDADLRTFKNVQTRIALLLDGDASICDLPRVMRLPGFPHLKDPTRPFPVTLLTYEQESKPSHTAASFMSALVAAEKKHLAPRHPASVSANIVGGINTSPDMKLGYPDGHRTRELTRRAGFCLGPQRMTLDQAFEACLAWNRYNDPPLPDEKVRSTVESIAKIDARKRIVADPQISDTNLQPEILQATFKRLAALSPVDYDRVRIKEAERLGARVGTLDDEVEKYRPRREDDSNHSGRSVVLPFPDPWPDPVDGADLLRKVASSINKFVVIRPEAAIALALWVIHAHAFEASSITPRLVLNSPEKQCGKTTLLHVIYSLVPKPLPASNVTAAAVFRAVEKYRPTLLVDEADTFLRDNEELRGVLNSGHHRTGSVLRVVGDNYDVAAFSTWCPTVIAAIGQLPGTIEDRSIIVRMRRALPNECVPRLDDEAAGELIVLCRMARRWTEGHLESLRSSNPVLPADLHHRAADNWRPLIAIADLAGNGWPQWARTAAAKLSATQRNDDGSIRVQLLNDIRSIFDDRKTDRIASTELANLLSGMEGRPWQDWKRGRQITANQVAKLLAAYEIRPKAMRITKDPVKGYERSDFEDAFKRYLAATPQPDEAAAVTAVTALK